MCLVRIELYTLCQTFCHLKIVFYCCYCCCWFDLQKRVDRISFNIEKWEPNTEKYTEVCVCAHAYASTGTATHTPKQSIQTHIFFDFFWVLMVMNACVTLCVNYLLTERIFFSRFFLFIICQCIRQNKWIRFSFADIKWIQRGIYGRIFIHAFISTSLIYFFQAENNSAFIFAAIQICFMCAMRWYDFTSHFNL